MAEETGLWLADAEENDLLEFTGTGVETDNTLVASTDLIIHGSYSFKATFGGTNNGCCGYYDFGGALTEIYMRLYFQIDTLTLADNQGIDILAGHMTSHAGTVVARCRIYGTGVAGQYGCRASFRDNTALNDRYNQLDGNIFQDDTEYFVELHWKQGNGNGVEEFWIDGDSKYSASNITNTNYTIQSVIACTKIANTPTAGTVYFDDVKASDSYIGAYSGAGSIVPLLLNQRRRWIA